MTEDQKNFEPQKSDIEIHDKRHGAQAPVVQSELPEAIGPMEIMMEAVRKGSGKEVLEQLQGMFEFQKQVDAHNAKKAHFEAVARFKAKALPVKKDKWNDWLKCWYTSLGQLLQTYNPPLGEEGLSVSFAPPQQDEKSMTVECLLAHSMGHVTSVSMTGPIDEAAIGRESGKPSRTPMQDLRSTFTYLRATTLEAVLGVSGTEATRDDDGNATGGKVDEFITEDQAKKITKDLEVVYGDDPSMYLEWLGIEAVGAIFAKDYKKAIGGLASAKKAKAEAEKANKDESRLGE